MSAGQNPLAGQGSSDGQSPSAELRSAFESTAGGVMTDEVGAITGALELLTRPAPNGKSIEALVRYVGAQDLYTVTGSPLRGVSEHPDQIEHQRAHELILESLTTPALSEHGNERPVHLLD